MWEADIWPRTSVVRSMVERTVRCWVLPAAAIALVAARCEAEPNSERAAGGPPKYKLEIGQELAYTGQSTYEYGTGDEKRSMDRWSEWNVWVTHKNDDGSWRLIIEYANASGKRSDDAQPPDVTLAYLDLFPDGTFAENSSFGYRFDPHTLFAKLPADRAGLEGGWQSFAPLTSTTYHYSTGGDPKKSTDVLHIQRQEDGIQNRVYLWTRDSEIIFSQPRGAVEKITTKVKQEWGANGTGEDLVELQEITQRDDAWIAELDNDFEQYRKTKEHYESLTSRLEQAADEAEDRLAQARDHWTDLVEKLENEVVRSAAEKQIASHDSYVKYQLEEAQRLSAKLGEPAPEWDTVDLAGNAHKLEDYRGKVMVLDFWYRGCGWCIRAMPQIKQLADNFAAGDVVVLGMNTDSELEDAQFVENALELNYPSVRIDRELPTEYGVRGFPTLVFLDRAGTIRHFHVGYSPTLREDASEVIRELLAETD